MDINFIEPYNEENLEKKSVKIKLFQFYLEKVFYKKAIKVFKDCEFYSEYLTSGKEIVNSKKIPPKWFRKYFYVTKGYMKEIPGLKCKFLPSEELSINEINRIAVITPRDIKQLATEYIYGIANIYDKICKDLNKQKHGLDNTKFEKEFVTKLNTEIPKIVQQTIKKQMFYL